MTRPTRLRAILFDLDDTLCDTEGIFPLRLEAVRQTLAGEVAGALLDAVLGQQARTWDPNGSPNRLQRLGDALGLSAEQRQHVGEVYNGTLLDHLRLHPGVKETLVWLRPKLVLGLITNGPSELQRAKLAALGIGPYFHTILISGEVGFDKPDPRIFLLALGSLSAEPHEALYVGDRPDLDIAGARAAGIPSIQVRRPFSFPLPPGPEADYTVEGITEIQGLLRAQGWLANGRALPPVPPSSKEVPSG